MRLAILFALLAFPVSADERQAFYGTWGTAKQCAGELIKPGGTVAAEPFEIRDEWLRQGRIWCRLDWFPIESREDGLFTGAYARCGEDAVRDYFLRIKRSGDQLTLHWDLLQSSGPLAQCPGS